MLAPLAMSKREDRLRLRLSRLLEDVAVATRLLQATGSGAPAPPPLPLPRLARQIGRARREGERLVARLEATEEESALLIRYAAVFQAFEPLLKSQPGWASGRAYHVVLRPGQRDTVEKLREELTALLGPAFEIRAHPLPGDETAVLILVPEPAAARVEQLLAAGRVSEVALPAGFAGQTLAQAMPAMQERLRSLPGELDRLRRERADLRRRYEPTLRQAARTFRDALGHLEAQGLTRVTPHAFVLEGWVPTDARGRVGTALARAFGAEVVLEELGRDQWTAEDAPVVLRNPRLFRPFELLVSLVPLPRYGSIDPTPFVAVFFPMFFGLMLGIWATGDAADRGLLLRRRSGSGELAALPGRNHGRLRLFQRALRPALRRVLRRSGPALVRAARHLVRPRRGHHPLPHPRGVARGGAHAARPGDRCGERVPWPPAPGDRPRPRRADADPGDRGAAGRGRGAAAAAAHPGHGRHPGHLPAAGGGRGHRRAGGAPVHAGPSALLFPHHGAGHRLGDAGGRGQSDGGRLRQCRWSAWYSPCCSTW